MASGVIHSANASEVQRCVSVGVIPNPGPTLPDGAALFFGGPPDVKLVWFGRVLVFLAQGFQILMEFSLHLGVGRVIVNAFEFLRVFFAVVLFPLPG